MMELTTDLPRLQSRARDSHKGDYGRALLIGGSRGMAGAIALAGKAAMRAGAGLATVATADRCLETVAQFFPCYTTAPLTDDDAGRIALDARPALSSLLSVATATAVGPGLGQSSALVQMVQWLYRTVPQPMVVDADGLNALALADTGLAGAGGPRILTPHPGEFARLCPAAAGSRSQMMDGAVELAARHQLVILLKGHRTFLTNGTTSAENRSGNPGMATGGSGDVLTGVITGLLCQSLKPFAAAQLGAHLHGRAGDLAAAHRCEESLTACDLIDWLPAAFAHLEHDRSAGQRQPEAGER